MMKLWEHDETKQLQWADEQPSARWHTTPTMYEDGLRTNITDEQYTAWYADSMVVEGVRMGPRKWQLTKTHDTPTVLILNEVSPSQSEWIVGYLPGGGAMALFCKDCGADWDGRRAVWSVPGCDKSKI